MDGWLLGQVSAVLTTLSHAQELFDGTGPCGGSATKGVRYGISLDDETLPALGISPQTARLAPWPLIRVFAPGPALSRTDAVTQHDTLAAPADAAPLTQANKPQ